MGKSLTRKIIESHFVSGSMTPGEEVFIKVDQTLTHDINAVMTYLAFEAIGLDRIRTECSVSYLDHNLLYVDHKTPDDHIYLQSAAKRFGVHVSRPGNGICHTVHVARFGAPGKVSMGGDSHTPHGGSIGMLCIGVGGMDVATAMTGVPMRLKMPRVINVHLIGKLQAGVNAKEVILEMLRRVTIKGGLGNVYEYTGPGAATLEVPQRATITNMGAELGATTSIFPADEQVRKFLKGQGREDAYVELLPDEDAEYDEVIEINLSELTRRYCINEVIDKTECDYDMAELALANEGNLLGKIVQEFSQETSAGDKEIREKALHYCMEALTGAGSR